MSALSKKQFPWSKEHNEQTGVTYHVHAATGDKIFNTLTGKHRWQIEGGRHHGELHTSLGEAKKVIEAYHEESK